MLNIKEADIVVIGKGIVGLSAAIAMRVRGHQVTLLDSDPEELIKPAISRVYAINQASCDLFKNLNVWDHIDKNSLAPYNHMHIWDCTNNQAIDFDSRIIGSNKLGYMLPESAIKQALLIQAKIVGVNLIYDYTVTRVVENSDNICVSDVNNRVWQAKLLIIADGAKSSLRDMLGVKVTSWPYYQQAIVANVVTQKSHKKTAYQVFQPQGPLAFLPMADLKQSSIVWSTTKEHATKLMQITEDEFGIELSNIFGDKLGKVELLSKRFEFPLHMRHVKNYSGSRWILMGDAAHTIHPLAGLGLNVGLADLNTWINVLQQNDYGFSAKRNLNCYQRKRKYALWMVIALMEGLHVLFTNNFLPIMTLRGLGLKFVNQISPLKRLIIEHASGTKAGFFNHN